MKRTVRQNPYWDHQPPLRFVDDLNKPYFASVPAFFGQVAKRDGETDVTGLYLANRFKGDTEGLLDTVYEDFNDFTAAYAIAGRSFPIYLKQEETSCFEAYALCVYEDHADLIAGDTEGIRRGVMDLEETIISRTAPYLPLGRREEKPFIHTRITRSCFAPTNRPPKNIDELDNDVDYYPDRYLNRLMHEGSNGVWIYTYFRDLLPSRVIPEYGTHYEHRIEKLNRVVAKCRRYGIGVFVFAIEPMALTKEIAEKHPDMRGATIGDWTSKFQYNLCVSSPEGYRYCYEAGQTLVRLVPDLAGFISITQGERQTSCASSYPTCDCPRCKNKTPGQRLGEAIEALRSGIREAKPSCETISWTYGHFLWQPEDVEECVRYYPDDVMNMQNFDSLCIKEQLGKPRRGIDYWLAFPDASDLFRRTALQAKKYHKHLYAKMQVCNCHDMGSIPYMPTPGILFDKYKVAKELSVEGVLQCWYLGNYPSLMSKAAARLSFLQDYSDKQGFLKNLAALYWGEKKAPTVVKAWDLFEQSYLNLPINDAFAYYSPLHNGVVWELALKPKNFQLPRSWQTFDMYDGDRIGECCLHGHTLDEVVILVGEMCRYWSEGLKVLLTLPVEDEAEAEQVSVAKTVDILFRSAYNILRFYRLRDKLGYQEGNTTEILAEMKALAEDEIRNSAAMIPLCRADGRLGYHSEAEGYQFFPRMIEERIDQLKELLATEFVEVGDRIKQGLTPLEYYDGVEDNDEVKRYQMTNGAIGSAVWQEIDDTGLRAFRCAYNDTDWTIEVRTDGKESWFFSPEFRLGFTDTPWTEVKADGELVFSWYSSLYHHLFGKAMEEKYQIYSRHEKLGEGLYRLTLKWKDVGLDRAHPMRFKLRIGNTLWSEESNKWHKLGEDELCPGDYGWLIP